MRVGVYHKGLSFAAGSRLFNDGLLAVTPRGITWVPITAEGLDPKGATPSPAQRSSSTGPSWR